MPKMLSTQDLCRSWALIPIALLVGCAPQAERSAGAPPAPASPAGPVPAVKCSVTLDSSSAQAAALSAYRIRRACALTEEQFLDATKAFD